MMNSLEGKKIWICSLGCRSNQYEGEPSPTPLPTRRRARGFTGGVRRARAGELHRHCHGGQEMPAGGPKGPRLSRNAVIAACGCWAQKITRKKPLPWVSP